MNSQKYNPESNTACSHKLYFTRAVKSVLFAVSMTATATSLAGNMAASNTNAYVDSVHQWGAWEMDIEPAAGGLRQAKTQALAVRDSKLRLRTNSISALAPKSPVVFSAPTSPITPPVVPVTPPGPPVTPPVGGRPVD